MAYLTTTVEPLNYNDLIGGVFSFQGVKFYNTQVVTCPSVLNIWVSEQLPTVFQDEFLIQFSNIITINDD